MKICAPFVDPRVGAVSGDLGVRNAATSLITRYQGIEYAIGISLGRRVGDMLGTMPVVSGAFGAFRRRAVLSVGAQDVEVGEDADLTMKLRRAGWQIRFAPTARALTVVPETIPLLIAQRLRWDRGLVTVWLRKFRGAFDPRQVNFSLREVAALLDVLVFQIVLALAFPAYVIWLFYRLCDLALPLLGATLVGYAVLDLFAFIAAAAVRRESVLPLLPYLPLYTLLQVSLIRTVRLVAIIQELIFRSSYRDPYVPARVMRQVERV
jgi:cellulose synthase/poly-beta-1,6-N-acetylglucosamine synthase-like glycosyltransferase